MRPWGPGLVAWSLLAAGAGAAMNRSPWNQHDPWFTLDGTRIHMSLDPEAQRIRARVHLRGHFRTSSDTLALNLHPGFTVVHAETAWGPARVLREGDDLELVLPRPGRPGERFHAMLQLAGSFHDPTRGPGPGRQPTPSPGVAVHLDPVSGLTLPRESYWYPRPPWADPQELEVRIEMPDSWVATARLFPEHAVPAPGCRQVLFLRSQGVVPRPVGLAAGPYVVEVRRFQELEVRFLRYARVLAEHPDSSTPKWQAVAAIVAAFTERFGPPGRGRLDLVELAGAVPRRAPPTFLGQGSFAWIQSPAGVVEDAELFLLARELARAWWERGVRMPSFERAGLIHFAAMLAVRWLRGEEPFLALCRRAAAEYPGGALPGRRLYPFEPALLEGPVAVPDPQVAAQTAVMLLMAHLQRQGEDAVVAALAAFTEAWSGRVARFAELLAELDARPDGS